MYIILRSKILNIKFVTLLTYLIILHLALKITIKGEIDSITNLARTAALNARINQVKGEIPNITNSAIVVVITGIENKISNVSNLHLFYKQSIFGPRPENCLSFSKTPPKKLFSNCLADDLLTSIV